MGLYAACFGVVICFARGKSGRGKKNERTDRRGEGGAPLRSGLPRRETSLCIDKKKGFGKQKVEKRYSIH